MWSQKEGAAKHERNLDLELEACVQTWPSNTNTSNLTMGKLITCLRLI